MSISEKLNIIAQNEQRVYDAGFEAGKAQGGTSGSYEEGRQAENKAFWDTISQNGNRNDLRCAFYMWDVEYIRPPYKLIPTDQFSGYMTFSNCERLKKVEKAYFDFSNKATGTNTNASWQYTFSGCYNLKVIEDIGLTPQFSYLYTFRNCQNLHTIEKLRVDENTGFSSAFVNCHELKNLTIDGTIGKNGFNLQYSTKLSKASLLSILNACNIDVVGKGISITLPKMCIDGATNTESLLSETGDAELYGAKMAALSCGYSIVFA